MLEILELLSTVSVTFFAKKSVKETSKHASKEVEK